MRSFIRHPTDIPIECRCESQADPLTEQLKDVGGGGLSFSAHAALAPGTRVTVRIGAVQPAFEAQARVVWCHPDGEQFLIGVHFESADDLFRARMVEQACHIEQYKREVLQREGRVLSGQEAAMEWIGKFAGRFPWADRDESP